MDDDPIAEREVDIDRFRDYLMMLARCQVGGHRRMDVSDVVQATLLNAQKQLPKFRGNSRAEMMAWLRRILSGTLRDALKEMRRVKRDVNREKPLDVDDSKFGNFLLADQTSPSGRLDREEQMLVLARGLEQLSDKQREAVLLRYYHGLTLEDIGRRLDCNTSSVAGLIARGSKQLQQWMREANDVH